MLSNTEINIHQLIIIRSCVLCITVYELLINSNAEYTATNNLPLASFGLLGSIMAKIELLIMMIRGLVNPITTKLVSHDVFDTVHTALFFISGYLINIDFGLFCLDSLIAFIIKYDFGILYSLFVLILNSNNLLVELYYFVILVSTCL